MDERLKTCNAIGGMRADYADWKPMRYSRGKFYDPAGLEIAAPYTWWTFPSWEGVAQFMARVGITYVRAA
jgi:hypothetical protein